MTAPKRKEFSIVREFKAPKEIVFDAFAKAEALAQWWGPKGTALTVLKLDFRPQGIFHYSMSAPDGSSMYGLFVYHSIRRSDLIEFVNSFSDEKGNITRAPFFDNWPLEIYNKIVLTEKNGITTMNLTGHPINAKPDEEERYYSLLENMQQGFGGTFDQLDAYLEKIQ
ncbi:MAG: SRPBCC family protein [Bacteroidia bacterium]